jgi:hypothetical protein
VNAFVLNESCPTTTAELKQENSEKDSKKQDFLSVCFSHCANPVAFGA